MRQAVRISVLCARTALALACLCGTAQAARPELNWYTFSLPPLYISDGSNAGEGVVDKALRRHLLPALGEYEHKVVEMPLKRLELALKSVSNACVLGLLKNPEREKDMLFSRPFLTQLPPGVMVRRAVEAQLKPYLGSDGRLSFSRLQADGALTVGIAEGRSYGAVIDELLARQRGQKNLVAVHTAKPARSLMQMAMLGRVDVVPALPYEASYLHINEGDDVSGLRFYPLTEQPGQILGYAACSRSPEGQQAIRRINEVLSRNEVREAIAAYYESWLDPDSRLLARQAYRQGIQQP